MSQGGYVTLTGFVAREPTLREIKPGLFVGDVRVGTTPRYLDRSTGEWRDGETSYYTVNCWRRLAAHVRGSLHKGDPVLVRGRFNSRTYEDKQGRIRTEIEITADTIGHDLSRGTANYMRPDRPRPANTGGELAGDRGPSDGDVAADRGLSGGHPLSGAAGDMADRDGDSRDGDEFRDGDARYRDGDPRDRDGDPRDRGGFHEGDIGDGGEFVDDMADGGGYGDGDDGVVSGHAVTPPSGDPGVGEKLDEEAAVEELHRELEEPIESPAASLSR